MKNRINFNSKIITGFVLGVFYLVLIGLNSCKIEGCTDLRAINYNPKADHQSYDCIYLQAPQLIAPNDKEIINGNTISFSWNASENATSYLVQFAADSLFTVFFL